MQYRKMDNLLIAEVISEGLASVYIIESKKSISLQF